MQNNAAPAYFSASIIVTTIVLIVIATTNEVPHKEPILAEPPMRVFVGDGSALGAPVQTCKHDRCRARALGLALAWAHTAEQSRSHGIGMGNFAFKSAHGTETSIGSLLVGCT